MTDSILRSYQYYSTTSIVPFPVFVFTPEEGSALDLLHDETQGYAINATTYDTVTTAAYVGGPVGGTIAVIDTGTPANNLSDVALNKGNLTNAGTSPKMVHHVDSPYVRWSPHNHCLSSQTFGDWTTVSVSIGSNTTVAPDGTTTADTLTVTGTGVINDAHRNGITVVTGNVYTYSIYVLKTSGATRFPTTSFYDGTTEFGVMLNTDTGVAYDASGWATSGPTTKLVESAGLYWRLSITMTATNTAGVIFWSVGVNSTGNSGTRSSANPQIGDINILWGAQVNRGSVATPYIATVTGIIGIPQSYDAAASKYGILVEPAATNICLRSEDLGTTWSLTGATLSANATTAPDGSTTADSLDDNDAGAIEYITQNITVSTSTVYTASIYMKAGTSSVGYLAWGTGATDFAVFVDLTNGDIKARTGIGTPDAFTSTSIGNGWYRITLTGNGGANTNGFMILAPAARATYAGGTTIDNAGTGTCYFWGVQLETGSVASSYITTLGAAVTRAADIASALDTTFPGSDTNNTIYLDYKPLVVSSGTRYGWAYWKDANNFYSLAGVTANPTMGNTNAGSPEFAVDLGTLVAGTRTQITIAAKGSDFDGSQDGAAPTAQGTATLTTAYTALYLGTFGTTGSELNGYIYRMVAVPYQRETVNSDLETWRYNF